MGDFGDWNNESPIDAEQLREWMEKRVDRRTRRWEIIKQELKFAVIAVAAVALALGVIWIALTYWPM